jgi:hypothetical protein
MAHPADTGPKAPGAFANARLSPEDADRLASMFRPSWELDDAPFTGPGTLNATDLRALQGGGTHADVRAVAQNAAHASNGAHAPPPATQASEPENSVIIDRTITAQDLAGGQARPAPAKPTGTILGMAAPPPPQQATQQATPFAVPGPPPVSARPPPPSQRPKAPAFNVPPPVAARAKPVSIDLEEGYPKAKSKTGLYAALGVGGLAVVGLVVWLASSSGSDTRSAAPAPTETQKVDEKLSAVPPPPPATTTAQPAAAVVPAPPPPATTAAAPAPAPIPQTPVAALPAAAPVPTHAPAAAPRYYGGGGGQTARPAGKPKGGQTIVRDVPF